MTPHKENASETGQGLRFAQFVHSLGEFGFHLALVSITMQCLKAVHQVPFTLQFRALRPIFCYSSQSNSKQTTAGHYLHRGISPQVFMAYPPLLITHITTAVGALITGGIALNLRKGTTLHRILGRIWVVLMVMTAMVSFGIRSNGHFSWVHLLSVVSLVGVIAAVSAAVRGRIASHRRGMMATYFSLVVTGAFTLLPGRRLGDLLWNALGPL